MAKSQSRKVSSRLYEQIRNRIPSASNLVKQAIEARIGQRNDVENYIRENFSGLVEELQLDAYSLYLEVEKKLGSKVIADSVLEQLTNTDNAQRAAQIVENSFVDLDKFFLSLTQSRRSRAGTAFQDIVAVLISKLGYPFDSQPIMHDSKPDFVMPSLA